MRFSPRCLVWNRHSQEVSVSIPLSSTQVWFSPFRFLSLHSFLAGCGGLEHRKKKRLWTEKPHTEPRVWHVMLGFIVEVGRRAKVPLKSPWRPVFLSLLGDSRFSGYFRSLLIGLLIYKALPHILLHLIFPITTGQLLFSSFYGWAKWSSPWLRNETPNWEHKTKSELEPRWSRPSVSALLLFSSPLLKIVVKLVTE